MNKLKKGNEMPELPEVETSRLGISPYLIGNEIDHIEVRQSKLRWQVSDKIKTLKNEIILSINRRGKYLLIELKTGFIVIHLGMSGSLRILEQKKPPTKHDHIDLVLKNGGVLRYTDPRRFGSWLWAADPNHLSLINQLGVEPLSHEFTADYLIQHFKNRKMPIKNAIMNSHIVVGVGNIYACESLFFAKISPFKEAKSVTKQELDLLVQKIKEVLAKAIEKGGTTLKDFAQVNGKPGYFVQELMVYGRKGKPCFVCQTPIESAKIGQRNTFYCPNCQK